MVSNLTYIFFAIFRVIINATIYTKIKNKVTPIMYKTISKFYMLCEQFPNAKYTFKALPPAVPENKKESIKGII